MHTPSMSPLLVAMACCLLAGCAASIRGAPPAPFDAAMVESSEFVEPQALFRQLVSAADADERNRAIAKALALVDVRYVDFRQQLVANKKHAGAATDALLLAITIAGGLTSSAAVKDNYLAASALLQGGHTIYEKDYLFDQSITALIAQMEANRSAKLLEIRTAMLARSIDEYPGQVALVDILEYHQAGTLFGAVAGVQHSAARQEAQAVEQLRRLDAPTHAQISALRDASGRLDRLVDSLPDAQQAALTQWLVRKGVRLEGQGPVALQLKQALASLFANQYSAEPDRLIGELEAAGFAVPH